MFENWGIECQTSLDFWRERKKRGGGNGARIQVGFVLKQAPKKRDISLLDRDRGSEVLKSRQEGGASTLGSCPSIILAEIINQSPINKMALPTIINGHNRTTLFLTSTYSSHCFLNLRHACLF